MENANGTPDIDRITIWIVNGKKCLAEGNHRWIAAKELGIEIPTEFVQIINKGRWRNPHFNQFDNMVESN